MFLKNVWYVAAESVEVGGDALLARTIIGEKLVFYRGADDKVRAFADVCPHRYAPLSMGRIEGNCIRCPYHGSLYDHNGHCVEVPGQQGNHGMTIGLKAYPIGERYGYIWVWMGEPTATDTGDSIPDWFAPADPNNTGWVGRADKFLSMPVYYELINDNLHDVSHVEFVHPETLGTTVIPQMYRMSEKQFTAECYVKKSIEQRSIRLDFHAEKIQGGPVLHQMLAYQRGREVWRDDVDWDLTLRYATPANFLFNHRTKAVGETDECAIQIASLHSVTPETESSSHYFYYTAHNLDHEQARRDEFTTICADALTFAFNQDKTLITAQMERVPEGGRNATSMSAVSFMGDTTPMLGRRLISNQIAEEQASSGATQT